MTDVAELARKSSVCWIEANGRTYPVWHEWIDDAIYVVGTIDGSASEQAVPDVADGTEVTVALRNKTERDLAAVVAARVEIVEPGTARWNEVAPVLKSGRLNSPDMTTVIDRWAETCRMLRLVPGAIQPTTESASRPRTLPRLS